MYRKAPRFGLTAFACVAASWGLLVSPAGAAQPGTDIDEVVIYGLDGDNNQLMRYTFDTDTFTNIGEVMTANGDKIDNTEALTWVPSGPAKGMYCIPRDGKLKKKLLLINPLDASAEVVFDTDKEVTAMATVWAGSTWLILAWEIKDDELLAIDPLARTVMTVYSIGGHEFEGFALGPDGTFYANTDTELYTIDLLTGNETKIGDTDTKKMESLEFAFGDYDPQINISGVPSSWTANGALLGFDDKTDEVVVINPATGETRTFPCAFATVDCEGLVVLTQATDPYGSVVVDACD